MLSEIKIGKRPDLSSKEFIQMLKLRYNVFIKRLNWNLSCSKVEYDQYDNYSPTYVLVGNPIIASCRLLPTTGKYMLAELWPAALNGKEIPISPEIWELSRLAVDKNAINSYKKTALLFKAAYDFAILNHIRTYIIVINTSVERLLTRFGIILKRLGSLTDKDGTKIVACTVDVDENLRQTIENIA